MAAEITHPCGQSSDKVWVPKVSFRRVSESMNKKKQEGGARKMKKEEGDGDTKNYSDHSIRQRGFRSP